MKRLQGAPMTWGLLGACLVCLTCAQTGPAPAYVLDAQNPDPSFGAGLEGDVQGNPFGEPPAAAPEGPNYGLVPAGEDAKPRLRYQGQGVTSYADAPIPSSGAVGFGCGFGYIGPAFQASYVGVGSKFFLNGAACGRCIRIQCDDASCEQPGKSVIALIVDTCGNCYDADLAVASPLFRNITGREPGPNPTFQLSWDVVDCGDLVDGNIKMLVKPGGSAFFQAFNFANVNGVLRAAQLNGVLLKRGTDNYWTYNPGKAIDPAGPFQLALLSTSGEVLRVQLGQLRSQDIGVQFKPANATSANATAPAPPPPATAPATPPPAKRSG